MQELFFLFCLERIWITEAYVFLWYASRMSAMEGARPRTDKAHYVREDEPATMTET